MALVIKTALITCLTM